jgi:PAS domain S-box-containing protein
MLGDLLVAVPGALLVFFLLRYELRARMSLQASQFATERRLALTLEAAREAIIGIDRDEKIFLFNPMAERIFGYLRQEAQGQSIHLLLPEGLGSLLRQKIPGSILSLNEIVIERPEIKGRRKDGTLFPAEVTVSVQEDGGHRHAVLFLYDISRRKEAEQALHASHQELERRVEERTAELARQAEQLCVAYAKLRARTLELTTLLALSRQMTSTLDLQPLLKLILGHMKVIFKHENAAILVPEETGMTVASYQGSLPEDQAPHLPEAVRKALEFRTVTRTGKPGIIDDIFEEVKLLHALHPGEESETDKLLGISRSWMGIPLKIKDRIVGLLRLDHAEPGFFTPHHSRLVGAIADQVAIALENARLYKAARRGAILEERQWLGRELHDSVSQLLYAIMLDSHVASEMVDHDLVRLKKLLGAIAEMADSAMAEMRFLIFELRPEYLEKEGLNASLRRLAETVRYRSRFELHLDTCSEPDLYFDSKEALYRICREALWNAVKHAHAESVSVRLYESQGQIVLEVKDNGVGFAPEGPFPGHLGIQSMRERIESVGGTLSITSSAGKGACVRAWIPHHRTSANVSMDLGTSASL